mmetsp:Transcript_8331/g.22548  ORF Transcript_8331/g.22548 Transcript_8331/m.22548 type:complete len:267 (+) Transcript_8331:246-1046(+)
MLRISALLILAGRCTKSSRSTSSLRFILAVHAWNTSRFSLLVGRGNSILRSRRPGLSNAGSNVSARLVAMITLTFVLWSNPSICVSSSMRIRCTSRSAPVCASNRAVAMESTSSIKMMEGACSFAVWNRLRTSLGPSPKYFCTKLLPLALRNVLVVAFATALASIVFPVPGGPYSRTPLGGSIPICSYKSACSRGNSTASRISCFCMSSPPISWYVTVGRSVSPMAWMVLSASGGSTSTSALECLCSATLAEGFRSSRFKVDRIRT